MQRLSIEIILKSMLQQISNHVCLVVGKLPDAFLRTLTTTSQVHKLVSLNPRST